MIFEEDVKQMIGKPVKFLTAGHIINDGVIEGFSGSGSVIIQCGDRKLFSSLKNIFLPESKIPDKDSMHAYVVAKYMERITNLNTLITFPLQFDIEHDTEAREAYIKCTEKITGIPVNLHGR